MDLYDAIYKRRIIRDFKEGIVPEDVVKEL